MNKEQKVDFIHNLCNSIRDEVASLDFPDNWDGNELREAAESAFQVWIEEPIKLTR